MSNSKDFPEHPSVEEYRRSPMAPLKRLGKRLIGLLSHGREDGRASDLLDFDPEFYLDAYPDVARAQIDPLEHFLAYGAQEGRDPNAWFNTTHYLATTPDVAASGLNPLAHYVRFGRHEGRSPRPIYQRGGHASQLAAFRQTAEGKPKILLISHIGGGGTEKHLWDLQAWLGARVGFYLLGPTNHHQLGASLRGTLRLSNMGDASTGPLYFDPSSQLPDLAEVLTSIGIDRIHVHHVLGLEEHLSELLELASLPYDLTLHDYYLLSPHPHLLGVDGRYFGDPEPPLVAPRYQREHERVTCGEWRSRFEWVWRRADRIIAPSRDLQERFSRFCDRTDILVVPHPEPQPPTPPEPQPLGSIEAMRILVLGEMTPQKGAEVLEACALEANRQGMPLRFHLLGQPYRPLASEPDANLIVHGAYREADLQTLIRDLAPHVIWFPAQWPETYSYTLSATLIAGVPTVAPNLGAFPERLEGRPWSWIVEWNVGPQELCTAFLAIREHFLRGVGPATAAPPRVTTAAFYDEAYLQPLTSAAHR